MKKLIVASKLIAVLVLIVYSVICFHSEREFNAALSAIGAFIILLDHKITIINAQLRKLTLSDDEE